jgi:benzoyl-CoA reductase/2-hydroxyglutaryl-CoA dehydratase subunit BcrC/BadD/HgdB
VSALHEAFVAPEAAARDFRAAGGKVVGAPSPHVPRELIRAAGMYPLLLPTDPNTETPIGDRYMEPFFDGPIRSMFDRLLSGAYDFADLVVIPRSGEGFLQMFYFVEEARRWETSRAIPPTYLFDLLHTPFWTTGRYVRGRMDALRQHLGDFAGRPITDDSIASAIRETNADHRLLMAVNALRREVPARLSGADALRVFATAWRMDRAAHTDMLRGLLAEAASAPPPRGVRVMVKGSPHDTTRFYDLVEDAGAVVVADDHLTGECMIEACADEDIDPMEALTQKYHLRMPSIRSYPQAAQDVRFLERVEAASVQAVVFYHDEHDDTLGWDYPDQKRALDQRGVPSVFLKQQSYRSPDSEAQREAVRALLEQVRA